ncbi:methyl-accepting chemotaxis protein [Vibrio sp. JCM 19236]|nr:methyl-accepting chemotaxis protein [Vibrio sp. JCM 19236]
MWRSASRTLAMTGLMSLGFMAGVAQAKEMPAQTCPIDINQELHLDGKNVTIIDRQGNSAELEEGKGLTIQGKSVALSPEQEKMLEDYRQRLNEYVPQARDIAQSGLDVANEIIDELSASFDNTDAFENVRQAVIDFYNQLEARYYQNGEMVLKPDAFEDVYQNWKQDFDSAREVFNREFFASAFSVLQEKMKSEDGINFTALQEEMAKLKASVEGKLKENSKQIQKQAEEYCDSMKSLAEQEKGVVQSIPELKDYQLFEI